MAKESIQRTPFKGRGISISFLLFVFCLRRVTFVNSDKSNQKRHSRGKGFRFPFPLENPPSLKRPKREGCGPPSLETPSGGVPRLRARRGDVGIAPYGTTAEKPCVGAGFYPARLIFSLPPALRATSLTEGGETRVTDSHASDIGHWLGMTPLRGVRSDRVVRPYGTPRTAQGRGCEGETFAGFPHSRSVLVLSGRYLNPVRVHYSCEISSKSREFFCFSHNP